MVQAKFYPTLESSVISTKAFNHAFKIIAPQKADLKQLPLPHYHRISILLHQLIDPIFIKNIVKKGSIALSMHTKIDANDAFSLLPSGILMMSIGKDTFETLGLNGQYSKLTEKYSLFLYTLTRIKVIKLNLLCDTFIPGNNHYERAKWCLKTNHTQKVEFLVSAFDNGVSFVSSYHNPIAGLGCCTELDFPLHFSNTRISCAAKFTESSLVKVPDLDFMIATATWACTDSEKEPIYDLLEWIGMAAIESQRLESLDRVDPFISLYTVPDPKAVCDNIYCAEISGFLCGNSMLQYISNVKECVRNGQMEWAVVCCWGFRDSLVSWNQGEHCYKASGGENDYAIVFGRDSIATIKIVQ